MYRIMPFNAWKGKKAYLYIHLEKAMAPHSKTLAWKIPWMEEPGRLQSMGSLRVRHDWATSLSLFTFMHWRRKWQPTPVFLPGESQGRGSPVAAIYGVTRSYWKSFYKFWVMFRPVSLALQILSPLSSKPFRPILLSISRHIISFLSKHFYSP